MSAASAYCEDLVRLWDYDRYMAAVFSPAARRAHLFALYAFNFEIAKTAETASQPVVGQIRLQWWRDTVEAIYGGAAPAHPVAAALAEAVSAHELPQALFDELLDARELDLETSPFADLAAMEAYADATSGHVMRLAARILGAAGTIDEGAGHAGIAYALAGLLRALAFQAARGRLVLPRDMVAEAGFDVDDAVSGRNGSALAPVIKSVAASARSHLDKVGSVPRRYVPALLPAGLVTLYLRGVLRHGSDPFRDSSEVPRFRRQLIVLTAAIRGSLPT